MKRHEHERDSETQQLLVKAKLEPITSYLEPAAQRLLSPLPHGTFINKPQEIDRFLVRIWPDGQLYFKGSRTRVEEFLRLCETEGIRVHVDHISLCG